MEALKRDIELYPDGYQKERAKRLKVSENCIFYAYLKEILLESISNNSIVVMENAIFHKRQNIQNIIKINNYKILYLPPYSSELNPIEKKMDSY